MQKPNFTPTKSQRKNYWRTNLKGFFLAVLIALFIRIFFVEPYKIPSESMYPNIYTGDMLMAAKFTYGFYFPVFNTKLPWFISPHSGSIVLFQTPTYKTPGKIRELINFVTFGIFNLDNNEQNPKYFIKRTIASPGSLVNISDPRKNNFDHQLIVNGLKFQLTPSPQKFDFDGSKDYLFFIEKGLKKSYVIQLKKQPYDFLNYYESGYIGDVYVPHKHDRIEFQLKIHQDNLEILKEAEKENLLPDMNPNDVIHVKVLSQDRQKLKTPIEFDINAKGFKTFYYNEGQLNSVLDSHQLFQLLLAQKTDVEVSKNYFLMMGDNRDNSSDSRYWGFVPNNLLIGSPLIRYYPFSRFGFVS